MTKTRLFLLTACCVGVTLFASCGNINIQELAEAVARGQGASTTGYSGSTNYGSTYTIIGYDANGAPVYGYTDSSYGNSSYGTNPYGNYNYNSNYGYQGY